MALNLEIQPAPNKCVATEAGQMASVLIKTVVQKSQREEGERLESTALSPGFSENHLRTK